nr:hypothetical protein [Tanacetum cinerariifolium]
MAPLTFADTHNMIAFLTKSNASEGFDQIVDFLNAHTIQYALIVNLTIYVLCIKQFWASVSIKKSNDVVKLQALIDRKKVIITYDTIRQNLQLDDADGIDCLPNEEIFAELTRMGYKKPSTNLVRNVDSPSKFLMYLRFLQVMINAQVDDLSSHNTKYTSPALTQKIFANMRRNGIGNCQAQAKSQEVREEEKNQVFMVKEIKEGRIAELDADEDVTLEDVDAEDTDEAKPNEVEEVLGVVTAAKLMTELVTTATPITIVAQVQKAKVKPKDKGKGILIKEPKPLKGQVQIDMDEAFARQLKAKLNANINWDDVMEQVKRREKQDNTVMRYQEKTQVTVPEEGSKRKGDKLEQDMAKKHRIEEEAEELKRHLYIMVNDDDDDVFTEATPVASKVPVVDYQIYHENNKPYYKIIRADGTH